MDVSTKIVGKLPPKSSSFNGGTIHSFHHPFWGKKPYFWKHPYGKVKQNILLMATRTPVNSPVEEPGSLSYY